MKLSQRLGVFTADSAPAPAALASRGRSHASSWPLGWGLALLVAGCSGGGGGSGGAGSGAPAGSLLTNPATGQLFVVDENSGGAGAALKIVETYWGRLVDVYDVDSATEVIRDFVISADIDSDGVNFRLERDPLTERERLTILHQDSSPEFAAALGLAESNLQVLIKKSLDPSELPPFTAVPRNSALVLRFNDVLYDGGSPTPGNLEYPGTISAATVKMLTGYAPTQPYEARIFPDPTHGDLIGGAFHSTRVIVDFTVSEDDANNTNLPVNSLGLPEAVNANLTNAVVRIPTRTSPANQQFEVLKSLGGRTLQFTGNGPTDPTAPTLDVVRAFRSGGKTSNTGDPNNGFLGDGIAPLIVGSQVLTVESANLLNPPEPLTYDLSFRFATISCAMKPRAGDVIVLPSQRVQVLNNYTGPISGSGSVGPVRVRVLCDGCQLALPIPGAGGEFLTTFRGLQVGNPPDFGSCFLRISPTPTALPASGLSTLSTITVTFSEPIDPTSVQAFDTFTLLYGNNKPSPNALYSNVIGRVIPSQDLRTFTFQPVLPLRKQLPGGQADRYQIEVLGGPGGVNDLAGNPLAIGLPSTGLNLATSAGTVDSAGISLKFNSGDEDGDSNPEIRGQILYDITRRLIKPRSVTRFSAVADASVPVVGAMIPFPQPIQTPLSDFGSKMMGLWRYHDVGFGLRDESNHNLDVEGLWWTPFFATVQADNFSQFQLSLAHSKFLPDEELSSGLLPNWTQSGLVTNFASNVLGNTGAPSSEIPDTLQIVHPKPKGYTIKQADTRQTPTGNTVAPWPWNRDVPQSQYVYWTWRDTGKIQVAAPNGDGADTQRLQQITKTAQTKFYVRDKVPTIGLPMLMEFRTYPDSKASAQNGFRVALAINSSAMPFFRVYSTGGVNVNNPAQQKIVDPDSGPDSVNATGAYPQNGLPAPGKDNAFYYGQGDFLVRISRMHTIWFDSLVAGTLYSDPVVEPSPDLLPLGTQVVVAFRGATAFTLSSPPVGVIPYNNAQNYDSYGDGYNGTQQTAIGGSTNLAFTPTLFNNPPDTTNKSWKSNISAINGARYFQARVTFVANPNTALVPELTSLGFAFRR